MENRVLSPLQAFLLIMVVAGCGFAGVAGLRAAGLLQRVELAHYDWMTSRIATGARVPDVVVIAVEEQDLALWGWPLPDEKLAEILEALIREGASAIGVDIYRDNPVAPGTQRLRSAFRQSNAIWINKLGAGGKVRIAAPTFAEMTGRVGFADVPVDFDGVARRSLLLVTDDTAMRLSFGLQLALHASGGTELKSWPNDPSVLMFGRTPVPRLMDGFGSYRGFDHQGYQIPIEYQSQLPVVEILPARVLLAGDPLPFVVSGRVAIVGLMSDTVKDNFRTPLNSPPQEPFSYGIQVHAAIVQHLLDLSASKTAPLKSPGSHWHLVMIYAASLIGATIGLKARTATAAMVFGPTIGLGVGMALSAAFSAGLWLPAIPVALAWLTAFAMTFSIIALMARKQRRHIATLFSSHLSAELSNDIWKNRHIILTGGKPVPMRLYTSILFADLAGSTTIGGTAEPEAFMAWATRVLDEMSRIARAHGGFVEKFTGDGILVVFGAPLPRETEAEKKQDAKNACLTALAIAKAVQNLNTEKDLVAPYRLRIGLHSGPVLGGTLGSSGSLQYNIMGNTVNMAARVEAFGKTLKDRQTGSTSILLSENLLAHTRDAIRCTPVGRLFHDDKKSGFEVFELIAMAQAPQKVPE